MGPRSVAAACLALLALTVIMALTNTAPLLFTLAVVGVIAIEIGRVGIREFKRESH